MHWIWKKRTNSVPQPWGLCETLLWYTSLCTDKESAIHRRSTSLRASNLHQTGRNLVRPNREIILDPWECMIRSIDGRTTCEIRNNDGVRGWAETPVPLWPARAFFSYHIWPPTAGLQSTLTGCFQSHKHLLPDIPVLSNPYNAGGVSYKSKM